MSDQHEHDNETPLTKVTFIIDGTVVESMQVDDRLAAIFLSEPTIVETTGLHLMSGDLYSAETGKFTRPAQELN